MSSFRLPIIILLVLFQFQIHKRLKGEFNDFPPLNTGIIACFFHPMNIIVLVSMLGLKLFLVESNRAVVYGVKYGIRLANALMCHVIIPLSQSLSSTFQTHCMA